MDEQEMQMPASGKKLKVGDAFDACAFGRFYILLLPDIWVGRPRPGPLAAA